MNEKYERTVEIAEMVEEKLENVFAAPYESLINNGIKVHGVAIKQLGQNFGVIIYIDGYLDDHFTDSKIAEQVIKHWNSSKTDPKIEDFAEKMLDFEEIKDCFRLRLINKKANLELLETVPHVEFLDLAVIVAIEIDDDYSTKVTDKLLKCLNIPFETAYERAKIAFRTEKSRVWYRPIDDSEHSFMTAILSNERANQGAIRIRDDEILCEIAQKIGDDLIGFPMSVHEFMLIPARESSKWKGGFDELSYMIQAINLEHIPPEEVLSDHPYFYKRGVGWSYSKEDFAVKNRRF